MPFDLDAGDEVNKLFATATAVPPRTRRSSIVPNPTTLLLGGVMHVVSRPRSDHRATTRAAVHVALSEAWTACDAANFLRENFSEVTRRVALGYLTRDPSNEQSLAVRRAVLSLRVSLSPPAISDERQLGGLGEPCLRCVNLVSLGELEPCTERAFDDWLSLIDEAVQLLQHAALAASLGPDSLLFHSNGAADRMGGIVCALQERVLSRSRDVVSDGRDVHPPIGPDRLVVGVVVDRNDPLRCIEGAWAALLRAGSPEADQVAELAHDIRSQRLRICSETKSELNNSAGNIVEPEAASTSVSA